MTDAETGNTRCKRLIYQAEHRGIREMDLILGPFARSHLAQLDRNELDQFERIIETPDQTLYAWLIGVRAMPDEAETPVMKKIMAFTRNRR